jgi:predicted MFS family arabinose efflux permease
VFQAPLRLVLALRISTAPGVLLATAMSTVVFTATPFLIRGIAIDRGLDVGVVGVVSTAQLLGFSLAAWGAGRFVQPSRRILVGALLLGVAANAASALAPQFWLLTATRLGSGVSLGLISWIAWAEAFGDQEKVGDVAVVGPLVGTVGAPAVALLIERSGPDELFFALAALHLIPLAFMRTVELDTVDRPHRQRHRPTRAAFAILCCLALITLGGSAVFVYGAAIGQDEVGLSSVAVSLAFSANALASVPSARWRGSRRLPGLWMALIAVDAAALTLVPHPVVFWIGLPLWGFAFWMAIPGAFALLAERSRYPDERAGDAQAVMAAGRVIGPLVGGAVYAASIPALGVVGGGILAVAAFALLYVEWRIHPEVLEDLIH